MDVAIFRWIMTSKIGTNIYILLPSDAFPRLKICQKCVCGWTPLGELTALPETSKLDLGGHFAAGRE